MENHVAKGVLLVRVRAAVKQQVVNALVRTASGPREGIFAQVGEPLVVGAFGRPRALLVPGQEEAAGRALRDYGSGVDEVLHELVVGISYGQVERARAQVLFALDHVDGQPREALEQRARYPRVRAGVADDEHVQQALAQRATVLHLPAGLVVAPRRQRIEARERGLYGQNDLRHSTELPAEVFGPVDRAALAIGVHQHPKALPDVALHFLLATAVVRLDQLAALLVIGQLVQETLVVVARLADHAIENRASVVLAVSTSTRAQPTHSDIVQAASC